MIRTLILATTAAVALGAMPTVAATPAAPATSGWAAGLDFVARRGADDAVKQRRNGRDDGAAHAKRGQNGGVPEAEGEAKRRPRTPGGSGCDSPRDLIEHPECRR